MTDEIRLEIEIPKEVQEGWNAESDFDKLATEFGSLKKEDQFRHLLTCFGFAAFESQSLEGSLVILSLLLARAQGKTATREASQNLREAVLKMTFGVLLKQLNEKLTLKCEDGELLRDALVLRNSLTHGFFLDHATDVLSETGRQGMVAQLVKASKVFRSAHLICKALVQAFMCILHVDQKELCRKMQNAIDYPPTPSGPSVSW